MNENHRLIELPVSVVSNSKLFVTINYQQH